MLMTKAFVLGTLAAIVLVVVASLLATVALDSAGREHLTLAVGGLELYVYGRGPSGVAGELRPGSALLAVALGAANAAAAAVLQRNGAGGARRARTARAGSDASS